MAIYAIGDLHFPGGQEKPMNVFSSHWDNHVAKIVARWKKNVSASDLVLIPGDISWAMHFDQAKADLDLLKELPGEKVLLRGNHDYWWSSIGKIRQWLPPGMHALQNDALRWQNYVICGSRGWMFPTPFNTLTDQDMKIFQRELIRLELSLKQAQSYKLPIIAMMHYPPLLRDTGATAFSDLLESYNVEVCCYGHLHDTGIPSAFQGIRQNTSYHLASCDAINFTPKLLIS